MRVQADLSFCSIARWLPDGFLPCGNLVNLMPPPELPYELESGKPYPDDRLLTEQTKVSNEMRKESKLSRCKIGI